MTVFFRTVNRIRCVDAARSSSIFVQLFLPFTGTQQQFAALTLLPQHYAVFFSMELIWCAASPHTSKIAPVILGSDHATKCR
jgi:hypothetical protein